MHVRVTCVHASHLSTSPSRMRAVLRICFTEYLIRLILAESISRVFDNVKKKMVGIKAVNGFEGIVAFL